MKFGYARVSTKDQKLERQLDALLLENIHKANIYKEYVSGAKKERPKLKELLELLESGDTLIITDLTRLGRNLRELLAITDKLREKGVELISLKEKIDTNSAAGKLMFNVFAILSDYERELISERTKSGLASARARGKKGGRPAVNRIQIEKAIKLYQSKDFSIKEICEMCNISKGTLYNYLKDK